MYQIKYMAKDSVQISAAATLLADAHRHIHSEGGRSCAPDTGEASRNAKHFLQRVINSANMELEATQAASIVLGMPSASGSHAIEYHNGWDFAKLAEVASGIEVDSTGLLTMGDEKTIRRSGADGEDDDPDGGDAEGTAPLSDGVDEECYDDYGADGDDEECYDDALFLAFKQPASNRQWISAKYLAYTHRAVAHTSSRERTLDEEECEADVGDEEDFEVSEDDAEVDEQDVEVSEDDGEVDELDVELSQDDTEVNELDMEVSEDDAEVDVELDVEVSEDDVEVEEQDMEVSEDDADVDALDNDEAVTCGPEALNDVEQIDLAEHFSRKRGGGQEHENGGEERGNGVVYNDHNGNAHFLCTAHHYAWRDGRLELFNALEFTQAFGIRKMTPQDDMWFRARAQRMLLIRVTFIGVLHMRRREAVRREPLAPLTLDNAYGRRVLVPRYIWPEYPCNEHIVLGSKWKKVSSETAIGGNEIFCSALCLALQEKQLFSKEEVSAFDLKDLEVDSFVRVGDEYFVQAGEGQGWEAEVKRVYPRRRAVMVEFCFAKDDNNRSYPSERLEMDMLGSVASLGCVESD